MKTKEKEQIQTNERRQMKKATIDGRTGVSRGLSVLEGIACMTSYTNVFIYIYIYIYAHTHYVSCGCWGCETVRHFGGTF